MTDAHTAGPFIAAIDQGTTSSRCIVFDKDGRIVSVDQKEHEQIFPKPGWVEHNATEIWTNVQEVVAGAVQKAGITREVTPVAPDRIRSAPSYSSRHSSERYTRTFRTRSQSG